MFTRLRSLLKGLLPDSPATKTEGPQDPALRIAVQRLRLLPIDPAVKTVTAVSKMTVLAELAALGYEVTNPEGYNDSLLTDYPGIVHNLKALRGGDVDYVPLFQGFPNKVPNQDAYFIDRLLGYIGNECALFNDGERLEDGTLVPRWLFDLKEFGADPISQKQSHRLFMQGRQRQLGRRGDGHTEWIKLEFVSTKGVEARARQFVLNNLYARSSIPESLRPDLEFLLEGLSLQIVDPARVVFKETRTYVSAILWRKNEWDTLKSYVQTPTDVLRLLAALTQSDVSLAKPIRYPRLSQAQRRFILRALEDSPRLEEDVQRYRGLWLALGRGLHPRQKGQLYPRTAAAFLALREGHIRTFESGVESALVRGEAERALTLLHGRPALLGRRLHQLLRRFPAQQVLPTFSQVAASLPLKNLLILRSYFRTIDRSGSRVVVNKKGLARVLPNNFQPLSPETVNELVERLNDAIQNQLRGRPSWAGKRLWIDEGLRNYTVPLQLRSASAGIRILGRGSRVPLDPCKVLRVFVYWKQAQKRTDLDLSLIQYGAELEYLGHVSYTRLKGEGVVHSGDIQSAPHGAAEFIDVDFASVEQNARYLAPQVFRFRGETFAGMTCHTGWMVRDQVDGDIKTFDIKTVQHKLDLTGTSSYCIPFLVDLWEKQIIYVDLYVNKFPEANSVEKSAGEISLLTGEMARMVQTRPNLYELATDHASARQATRVESKEQSDLSIGLRDCDYNVEDFPRILADLL